MKVEVHGNIKPYKYKRHDKSGVGILYWFVPTMLAVSLAQKQVVSGRVV